MQDIPLPIARQVAGAADDPASLVCLTRLPIVLPGKIAYHGVERTVDLPADRHPSAAIVDGFQVNWKPLDNDIPTQRHLAEHTTCIPQERNRTGRDLDRRDGLGWRRAQRRPCDTETNLVCLTPLVQPDKRIAQFGAGVVQQHLAQLDRPAVRHAVSGVAQGVERLEEQKRDLAGEWRLLRFGTRLRLSVGDNRRVYRDSETAVPHANARLLDIRFRRFRRTIAIHIAPPRGGVGSSEQQALDAGNKLRSAVQRNRPAGERLSFGGNVSYITRNVLNISQDIMLRSLLDRLERLQRLGDACGIVAVCAVQRQQNLERLIIALALPDRY